MIDLLADNLYERVSRRFGETVFLDLDIDGPFVQLSLHPLGWDGYINLIFAGEVVLSVGEHVRMEFYSDDAARTSDDVYDTIVEIARHGVYAYRTWGMIGAGFGPPPSRARVLQYQTGWETDDTAEN